MVQHTASTLTASDGHKLFTQSWQPDQITPDHPVRGTIILQHGVGEHSGRYDHVGRYFAERGYSVHAMDSRGHGRSANGDMGYFARLNTLVEELKQFIESVNQVKPLFLIGHSMGGLIALCYAIRYGESLTGLVVSGAALDSGESVPAFAKGIARVLGQLAPRMGIMSLDGSTISRDPKVLQAAEIDPLIYHGKMRARVGAELLINSTFAKANLGRVQIPILILHGGADRLVSPSSSHFAHAHVGSADKTLKIYDGLYHEVFNEPEREVVLEDVATWLAQHA